VTFHVHFLYPVNPEICGLCPRPPKGHHDLANRDKCDLPKTALLLNKKEINDIKKELRRPSFADIVFSGFIKTARQNVT
jgi:hypothetical protein